MPYLAPTACNHPGCAGVWINGKCTKCGASRRKWLSRPDDRESSASRGYGHRWRKLRLMILRANPLCELCKQSGRVSEATDVHHKIPKRDGGKDTLDNLQALCHACHSRLTAAGG